MTGSGGQSPAELHLGDRLAALVDGELGHDTRERVLAHLATCCKCKAEADAQRRLKSVFAEAAPPPLSEGFLARLQSLPGTGLEGDPEGRTGAVDADGRWDASRGPGRPGGNAFGESFSLIPAAVAPHRDRSHRDRGFRVHAVPDASRGSRSRRFAFAAAGAVSLAAFALGGAQPLASVAEAPGARAEDPRATATPLARTTGGVRDDGRLLPLGFTAATRPAPAAPGAPTPPGAPLLRPSTAAPLPPLARAALPGSGGPTGDSAR